MSEETIFYIRLKEQIKIRKTSFNQVERDLGYPRNSLNNYKNRIEPSGKRLVELAEYFMVSPGFLIGKEGKEENKSFKTFFQKLDFEQKREIYKVCEKWNMSQLFRNNQKSVVKLDREMGNERL